jgi:hypothetical protein
MRSYWRELSATDRIRLIAHALPGAWLRWLLNLLADRFEGLT